VTRQWRSSPILVTGFWVLFLKRIWRRSEFSNRTKLEQCEIHFLCHWARLFPVRLHYLVQRQTTQALLSRIKARSSETVLRNNPMRKSATDTLTCFCVELMCLSVGAISLRFLSANDFKWCLQALPRLLCKNRCSSRPSVPFPLLSFDDRLFFSLTVLISDGIANAETALAVKLGRVPIFQQQIKDRLVTLLELIRIWITCRWMLRTHLACDSSGKYFFCALLYFFIFSDKRLFPLSSKFPDTASFFLCFMSP